MFSLCVYDMLCMHMPQSIHVDKEQNMESVLSLHYMEADDLILVVRFDGKCQDILLAWFQFLSAIWAVTMTHVQVAYY